MSDEPIVPSWDSSILSRYDTESASFFVISLINFAIWATCLLTYLLSACCTECSDTESVSVRIIYHWNWLIYSTITIKIIEIIPVFSECYIKFDICITYLVIVVILTENKVKTLITDFLFSSLLMVFFHILSFNNWSINWCIIYQLKIFKAHLLELEHIHIQ